MCQWLDLMLKLETHFDMSRNPLFVLQMLATELHPVHLQPARETAIIIIITYDKQGTYRYCFIDTPGVVLTC